MLAPETAVVAFMPSIADTCCAAQHVRLVVLCWLALLMNTHVQKHACAHVTKSAVKSAVDLWQDVAFTSTSRCSLLPRCTVLNLFSCRGTAALSAARCDVLLQRAPHFHVHETATQLGTAANAFTPDLQSSHSYHQLSISITDGV